MELSISLMSCSQGSQHGMERIIIARVNMWGRDTRSGWIVLFFVARGIEDIIFDRVDRNAFLDREIFVIAEQRR